MLSTQRDLIMSQIIGKMFGRWLDDGNCFAEHPPEEFCQAAGVMAATITDRIMSAVPAGIVSLKDIADATGLLDATRMSRIEDGHVVLSMGGNCSNPDYDIALDRCDTPEKILGWIFHLTEKRWVTTQHIRDFMSDAARENNVAIEHHL